MKFLEILNKINTACLFAYLVYFVLGYNDFFISKEQSGAAFVAFVMFFTTFICGGITLICAAKTDVDTRVSTDEILKELKRSMLLPGIICIAELAVLLLFFHKKIILWCIGVLLISFGFVIMEKIVIPKITRSTVFKISLPWYVYPLPFVIFLSGNIYLSGILNEDVFGKVAVIIFVLCGIMLAAIAWHGYYEVDEQLKTIEKNYGIISVFRKNSDTVCFDSIQYVESKGIYYIIHSGDDKIMKISRLYSGIRRFKQTLNDNAIIVTN